MYFFTVEVIILHPLLEFGLFVAERVQKERYDHSKV
jgi:hypothetical protein